MVEDRRLMSTRNERKATVAPNMLAVSNDLKRSLVTKSNLRPLFCMLTT